VPKIKPNLKAPAAAAKAGSKAPAATKGPVKPVAAVAGVKGAAKPVAEVPEKDATNGATTQGSILQKTPFRPKTFCKSFQILDQFPLKTDICT
jgi:hypothetical protein